MKQKICFNIFKHIIFVIMISIPLKQDIFTKVSYNYKYKLENYTIQDYWKKSLLRQVSK